MCVHALTSALLRRRWCHGLEHEEKWGEENVKLITGPRGRRSGEFNEKMFPQRQVGHLKSWWMFSLHAHKCPLYVRFKPLWRIALPQLCGNTASWLRALVPSVQASVSVSVRACWQQWGAAVGAGKRKRETSVELLTLCMLGMEIISILWPFDEETRRGRWIRGCEDGWVSLWARWNNTSPPSLASLRWECCETRVGPLLHLLSAPCDRHPVKWNRVLLGQEMGHRGSWGQLPTFPMHRKRRFDNPPLPEPVLNASFLFLHFAPTLLSPPPTPPPDLRNVLKHTQSKSFSLIQVPMHVLFLGGRANGSGK